MIQVGLGFFQALEAEALQRCFLRMADTALHLPLSVRVRHAAWEGDGAVMPQHIPVERIERGIVDVGCEHALAQVIEHDYAGHPGQPTKGFLMQLCPSLRTGAEHQQANRLATVARSEEHTSEL